MSSYYPSFNYLGENSRERSLVISHFDADSGEADTFLGMEPIYTESADGSRRLDYGAKYNNVASFRITTIKPDGSDLSVDEIREHLKWLTGSKRNGPFELVEHFSEEFICDGKKTSFQLSETGAGKNLLDFGKIYASNSSTVCEFPDDDVLRIYTIKDREYAGVKSQTLTLKAGVTYTFSLDVTEIRSGDIRFGFRYGPLHEDKENDFAVSATVATSTGHFVNRITPKTDIEVYPSVLVTWSTAAEGDATFKNLQVEVGSIDTAYTPHELNGTANTIRIFSVSVNGDILKNYGYSPSGGILSLYNTPIPSKGAVIKVSYGRIKCSFTGRITNAWQYKMDARTIGLIFEFTSISPWAYSSLQLKNAIVNDLRYITIFNKTDDLYGYTLMNTVFTNTTGTSVTIVNENTGERTIVTNLAKNETITISDNMMITSDKASKVFGNSFNYVFPRLVAGENRLTIYGTGNIQFQYYYCIKIGDCAMDINVISDPIYDDDGNIQLDVLPWSRITDTPTTYQGYGITNVYSKVETDQLVAPVAAQISNMYSKAEVNNMYLSLKSDLSKIYTKSEVDKLLSNITARLAKIYTKSEVDALFDDVYSKAEVNHMYLSLKEELNNIQIDEKELASMLATELN